MRVQVVVASLVMAHASTADANKFAVACRGTSYSESTMTGDMRRSTDALQTQVYVIDEEKSSVQHALIPRQEFETVCALGKGDPSVSISPGLILVSGAPDFDQESTDCSLELDRKSGKGEQVLKINFADGNYHKLRWVMSCAKSAIPQFDTKNNKF